MRSTRPWPGSDPTWVVSERDRSSGRADRASCGKAWLVSSLPEFVAISNHDQTLASSMVCSVPFLDPIP